MVGLQEDWDRALAGADLTTSGAVIAGNRPIDLCRKDIGW